MMPHTLPWVGNSPAQLPTDITTLCDRDTRVWFLEGMKAVSAAVCNCPFILQYFVFKIIKWILKMFDLIELVWLQRRSPINSVPILSGIIPVVWSKAGRK
jgi:hypothetical protein